MDNYFWRQTVNFSNEIEAKAKKIEKRTKEAFVGTDWNFNTLTREWSHRDGTKILLEKTDTQSSTVLKEKIVARALAKALPSDQQAERHLQDLYDAKVVVQQLLHRELDTQRAANLAKIKQTRLDHMFRQGGCGVNAQEDDY